MDAPEIRRLRATLVADGTSDKCLTDVLNLLLREVKARARFREAAFEVEDVEFFHFDRLINPPKTLAERIERASEDTLCQLLFVHRDAEKPAGKMARKGRGKQVEETYQARVDEIAEAMRSYCKGRSPGEAPRCVYVVPVRMTEAWLLTDEQAIRRAAGNPNGRSPLGLPPLGDLETRPDPKALLHAALEVASEQGGRRRRGLNVNEAQHLVSRYMTDLNPLRSLYAFRALEQMLEGVFEEIVQWPSA